MSSAVTVEALTVAHGAVPAVRDVSFTAQRGEVLVAGRDAGGFGEFPEILPDIPRGDVH